MDQISAIEITIGSFHLEIPQSILVWFGICIAAAIFFYFAGKALDRADPSKKPTGLVYISEEIYNLVLYTIKDNLGNKVPHYLSSFGTVMLCMVAANLVGLIGFQNPTTNVSFNATLAVTVWLAIQFHAVKKGGLKARFKELCDPMPLLLPLNIIGELALPISLTMRLFGNILAGSIISILVYTLIKNIAPWGYLGLTLTPFLHMYFDIFSGVIQTYVFFTLASYFLGEQVRDEQ